MSLKIKIPKLGITSSQQLPPQSSGMQRKASKRRIPAESEDEYENSYQQATDEEANPDPPPRAKRARTSERSISVDDVDVDIDGGAVSEPEEDLDIEGNSDTRYAPDPGPSSLFEEAQRPVRRNSRGVPKPDYRALAGETSGRRKSVSSTSKPKRTAVYTDEEDEYAEDDNARRRIVEVDEEDFEPEPAPKRGFTKRGRAGSVSAKGGKGKGAKPLEKEIVVRDERKVVLSATRSPSPSSQGTKRPHTEDEEQDVMDVVSSNPAKADTDKGKEPILPAFKKRKLPTIKKNKPPLGATNGSAGPSTPKTTESERLPLPAARKLAAMAPNADFDLRDASVYAQLFHKPGGTTPNSGLNRKEKEEERRKELNRMREEARAKRLEETKHTFNLQAQHEKISRFEENLHLHKSMAVYPNILGAVFKDMHDRKKRESQKDRR